MGFPRHSGAYLRTAGFVWPLALGMANNAVMQFADRVFLARESVHALEAILPSSLVAGTVIGFFQTLVAYSGTFVAQYFGARDERGCAHAYRAGVWLALASAVICVATVPLGLAFFDWCGHAPPVLARERSYFSIVMLGGGAICLAMAASGYFTGRGRSRFVFHVNLIGNVLNVALDPLLIFGWGPFPAWGMAGAAVATVFAQCVQAAILCCAAWRDIRRHASASAGTGLALRPLIGRMIRFGAPSGAHTVFNLLSFTVFVFMTGRLGETEFAVSNAMCTVNYLLYAPLEGFAIGAGSLVGQRMGADDPPGAFRAGNRVLVLGLAYVVIVFAIAFALRDPILNLFIADDGAANAEAFRTLGRRLFVLMMFWQLTDAAETIVSGALKGAGDTRFVMWWMFAMGFVFWLPLLFVTYWLCPTLDALWGTTILYVTVFMCGTLWRWVRGSWHQIRLIA